MLESYRIDFSSGYFSCLNYTESDDCAQVFLSLISFSCFLHSGSVTVSFTKVVSSGILSSVLEVIRVFPCKKSGLQLSSDRSK